MEEKKTPGIALQFTQRVKLVWSQNPFFIACMRSQEIWQDLELCDAAREQQLKDITDRALGVWSGAVEHAENHRKGIRRRIDDAAAEMRSIAELLGELAAIEDPNSSMVGPSQSLPMLWPSLIRLSSKQEGVRRACHPAIMCNSRGIRTLWPNVAYLSHKAAYIVTSLQNLVDLHISFVLEFHVSLCAGILAHQPGQDAQTSI